MNMNERICEYNVFNQKIKEACQTGNLTLIKIKLPAQISWYNHTLYYAAMYGDIPIMEYLMSKGADKCESAFSAACDKGNLPAVKFLISKGVNDWPTGMYFGCKSRHLDIINLMIEKGVRDFQHLTEQLVYELLNMGISHKMFIKEEKYASLFSKITLFKSSILVCERSLIPPLLQLVSDYSLK